ncbi:MAG: outer membrane lipoprotein carrier protein LolA [Bacteroidales bacterium]
MRKKLLISISIIFLSFSLFGQDTHKTPYEIKGEDLTKKAAQKIRDYESLKVEFTYIMENSSMDIYESLEGTLFSKGSKYYMEVGNNIFISDGTTIWNYVDDLEEVQISSAEDAEGGLTPTLILEEFEDQFKATFIREETHKGKKVDIIDLVPETPQTFFKYRLALGSNDQMIAYTIAYDRHGGTYTYNLDNMQTNISIPDSKFKFDESKFPNAFINDLR